MQDYSFTIVDVETTGASPWFDRVIEVGAIRVEKGQVVKVLSKLINPSAPIPEFISKMTGITEEEVKDAPSFSDIKHELLEICSGSVFVAHNVEFDYSFLQSEFKKEGLDFKSSRMCTVRLSRKLYPQYRRHNLSELISRHEFSCERRHRALDDALVLWDFLNLAYAEFPKSQVDFEIKGLIKPAV